MISARKIKRRQVYQPTIKLRLHKELGEMFMAMRPEARNSTISQGLRKYVKAMSGHYTVHSKVKL